MSEIIWFANRNRNVMMTTSFRDFAVYNQTQTKQGSLTFRRYLSTISRPQEVHRIFPCREATAWTEEDDDEESEDGEYESSSKMSSGPEEPCHRQTTFLTKQHVVTCQAQQNWWWTYLICWKHFNLFDQELPKNVLRFNTNLLYSTFRWQSQAS